MSKTALASGVCAACQHSPGCIYEASASSVILQCEQFELAFPAPTAQPICGELERMFGETENSTLIGLCSNCDNRRTCIYPKPEGGVWHCDEYL